MIVTPMKTSTEIRKEHREQARLIEEMSDELRENIAAMTAATAEMKLLRAELLRKDELLIGLQFELEELRSVYEDTMEIPYATNKN